MTDTITSPQLLIQLATELNARVTQVHAAVDLLDGGATVPFIARYRKEATGGLDDTQLRLLEERLAYLRELEARRIAVIASVKEQGKLTDELLAKFANADTKQALEDLYLPFKPKRVTKAMMARAAGLEPLADALLADPTLTPLSEAERYVAEAVKAEVKDALGKAVDFSNAQLCLDGARDILSERWAEDAALLAKLRDYLWSEGQLTSTVLADKATDNEAQKFRDYFEYSEPIAKVPSHRALAVFRGRTLGFLDAKLMLQEDLTPSPPAGEGRGEGVASRNALLTRQPTPHPNPLPQGERGQHIPLPQGERGQNLPLPQGERGQQALNLAEGRIANHVQWQHQNRAADDFIKRCVSWTWKVKLSMSLERELFTKLREQSEEVAIKVFGDNLRDLLLGAPAGAKVVMGLDPGIRTGVKVAVVDKTGKVVDTATVYPHEPRKDWDGSLHTLTSLCKKHKVELISIGNGTASRETDKLAGDVMKLVELPMQKLVVSEAGASVYSASEYASQELPELDVSLRGAVSIARRVQDPLAELVKIEPKSIGVGQYQHDVNQMQLAKKLDAAVEDCVNSVGVDVNTASAPLLSRVAGLSANVARAVVKHRDTHGAFASREALRGVQGLGDKTFEQAAGFLRVMQSANPLDASAVHPESYPLVEKLLTKLSKPLEQVMGKSDVLKAIKPEALADEKFGIFTVRDVLSELEKPGRDPRPSFKVAKLADGVEDITDLRPDMMLEGTVTNVAAFGAFIDIGVHQDGLVHVSQLADRFVSDAREVVKAGDIVKVRVVEVDVPRKRIALTMKLQQRPINKGDTPDRNGSSANNKARNQANSNSSIGSAGAMAEAFAKLKR